jgi:hypothetical protein
LNSNEAANEGDEPPEKDTGKLWLALWQQHKRLSAIEFMIATLLPRQQQEQEDLKCRTRAHIAAFFRSLPSVTEAQAKPMVEEISSAIDQLFELTRH